MIFNVNNIAGKSKIETVPSVAGPLVYNGSEQSPVWLAYDPEQLSISGITSAVNAGTYLVAFTPTDRYKWADGSIAAKTVEWTIAKVPGSLSLNSYANEINGIGNTIDIAVFRSGDGAITLQSSNSSIATAVVSGDGGRFTVTAHNVGTATITVSVAEGTNHTAPSSVTYTITVTHFLFRANDQYTNITGGWLGDQANQTYWNVIDLNPYYKSGGYAKVEGGALKLHGAKETGYGGHGAVSIATKNKIDLTNIRTITVKASVSNPGLFTKVGVTSTGTIWSSGGYWNCAAYTDLVNGTTKLDVSGLSGYYNVVLGTHTMDGYENIYVSATEVSME